MLLENEKNLPGISREAEEIHLAETLEIIQKNIENYGRDVSAMHDEIEDMLEHFHDDNPELINTLENTRLKGLRDSLLPRLMSGEIDVSDIAI